MSKRLSDSEVWKKPWFYDMEPKYKLFWFYILSDCDAAGIWSVNLKLAENIIGAKLDPKTIIEKFNGQIQILNGGGYWLIKDFIKFQYGYPVAETAKMRKKLADLLSVRGIDIDTLYEKNNTVCDTVSIGYPYSIDTVKDKDKDIVKDNRKGVQGENKKDQPPIQASDLTDELKEENPKVYALAKMVLENCPDVMAMKYPLSLLQLIGLVKKYGSDDVEKIIKAMQNKGLKYLKQKSCRYAYLTIENWIKR